jgi:hypothetical protein
MSDVPPWTWRNLDANGAGEAWKTLSGFVDWLVGRYDLGDLVPACWWCHGAVTEELTALWTSWIVAYLDPEAEPDAPLIWHERFAGCRSRISEWDRMGCAQRGHRAGAPAPWQRDKGAFASFVEDDCAKRAGPHRLVATEESESWESPAC